MSTNFSSFFPFGIDQQRYHDNSNDALEQLRQLTLRLLPYHAEPTVVENPDEIAVLAAATTYIKTLEAQCNDLIAAGKIFLEGAGPLPTRQDCLIQHSFIRNAQAANIPKFAKLSERGHHIELPELQTKPFTCPVIGCEKAYKSSNGLKYHKQHGHEGQQLQLNDDGRYSILDPKTFMPCPGTLSIEKEKPYPCGVCYKRYKSLNGLKYHQQHST